jgi:hypothetical protein
MGEFFWTGENRNRHQFTKQSFQFPQVRSIFSCSEKLVNSIGAHDSHVAGGGAGELYWPGDTSGGIPAAS